jgi:hypothetical protein
MDRVAYGVPLLLMRISDFISLLGARQDQKQALRFFMEWDGLRQSDLPEIGNQAYLLRVIQRVVEYLF